MSKSFWKRAQHRFTLSNTASITHSHQCINVISYRPQKQRSIAAKSNTHFIALHCFKWSHTNIAVRRLEYVSVLKAVTGIPQNFSQCTLFLWNWNCLRCYLEQELCGHLKPGSPLHWRFMVFCDFIKTWSSDICLYDIPATHVVRKQ